MRRPTTAMLASLLALASLMGTGASAMADGRSEGSARRDDLQDRVEADTVSEDAATFDVSDGTTFQTDSCIPDAANDTYPGPFGKADIVSVCAYHSDSSVLFELTTKSSNSPVTDANWINGITGWGSNLDINDDLYVDGTFLYWNDGTGVFVDVFNVDGEYVCTGETGVDGNTLVARIPTSCLGEPEILNADAMLFYDSDWDDPEAPIYDDFLDGLTRTAPGAPAVPAPPPVEEDPVAQPVSAPTTARSTARLAGADRIATSVAISRHQFTNGASTVYLSRSDEFADSISSGSLTAGPVLLVPQCGTVPLIVLEEVQRLGATKIVALGGEAAVCDGVLAQVANA